jgi:pimeloyl-ACP methyl ester carboxylesterase
MSDDAATPDSTTENNTDSHDHDEDRPEKGVHVTDGGGDGRPVVLIHGWPLDHTSWSEQVPALKDAGYRVVTYDRRGFGESDAGDSYGYDKLAGDLDNILTELDLHDVTLVGFSMGGGEVARYLSAYGDDRVRSVVFAAAVPPYLLKGDDNPDGPLEPDSAQELRQGLEDDRDAFFDDFMKAFFSAGDDLKVSEEQRQEAVAVCKKSDQEAALGCMDAWATTDFRPDLEKVRVPALVIHGDSDGTVPFEGSGRRTAEALDDCETVVIEGGPHGINTSHADEFNRALLDFLQK